jgi:hypothetical protein
MKRRAFITLLGGADHSPDESMVRRRVAVVWRELNRA